MDCQVQNFADKGEFFSRFKEKGKLRKTKVINFFGKNPPTVNEDVAKIVEWEKKIGEITDHEYAPSER